MDWLREMQAHRQSPLHAPPGGHRRPGVLVLHQHRGHPGRAGADLRLRDHFPQHHRPQVHRRPHDQHGEAGLHRHPGRGRGPRNQQPHDRDPRVYRASAGADRRPARHPRHPEGHRGRGPALQKDRGKSPHLRPGPGAHRNPGRYQPAPGKDPGGGEKHPVDQKDSPGQQLHPQPAHGRRRPLRNCSRSSST